jgi:hypothetical protein
MPCLHVRFGGAVASGNRRVGGWDETIQKIVERHMRFNKADYSPAQYCHPAALFGTCERSVRA